jgi:hypothetical protein
MGESKGYRGKRRKNRDQVGQVPAAAQKDSHRGPDTSQNSAGQGEIHTAQKRKPLRRWQKVLLSIAAPSAATALGLTLATLGQGEVNKVLHPAPQPTAPSPSPTHGRIVRDRRRHGRLDGGGIPYDPLRTIFALPIDPSGNMTWVFPQDLALNGAQRARIYELDAAGQYQQLYDYLYRLGGFLVSADTTFYVQNRSSDPVAVENIQTVDLSCQAPLTGAMLEAPERAGAEPNPQLGTEIGSGDSSVMTAPGQNPHTWQPDPFSIPVVIPPNGTFTFNIRAVALEAACSFQYEITEVVNGRTITQLLSNDVFRVSAIAPDYRSPTPGRGSETYPGYQYVYMGGTANPQDGGNISQVYPPANPRS